MRTRPRLGTTLLVSIAMIGLSVRASIAFAQPSPPPPSNAPAAFHDPHRPDAATAPARRAIGLLVAGIAVLAGSYAFTALVGLQMRSGEAEGDPGYSCPTCDTVGSRLLLPVVGPWLALPAAEGADGKILTAVMGTAQAAGLVLTMVGTSRFMASANPEAAGARRGVAFGLVPLRDGAFGVLRAVF